MAHSSHNLYPILYDSFFLAWNKPSFNYLIWLPNPSSSAARLPADEPALASIMTHDHAKDLCASERGPLRI